MRFWLDLGIMQECNVAEHNISKCNSKCEIVCLQHLELLEDEKN